MMMQRKSNHKILSKIMLGKIIKIKEIKIWIIIKIIFKNIRNLIIQTIKLICSTNFQVSSKTLQNHRNKSSSIDSTKRRENLKMQRSLTLTTTIPLKLKTIQSKLKIRGNQKILSSLRSSSLMLRNTSQKCKWSTTIRLRTFRKSIRSLKSSSLYPRIATRSTPATTISIMIRLTQRLNSRIGSLLK